MISKPILAALAMLLLAAPIVARAGASPFDPGQLRNGGYVLVMRHAHSPGQPPAAGAADKANVRGERQLDEAGRAAARAMGEAIRQRRLPFGEILTSPAYRAMQTAQLLGLGPAATRAELGDGGASMAAQAAGAAGDRWLKAKASEAPRSGANTLLVTHGPNISRAFGLRGVADGESLIFRPDGRGGTVLAGRVTIEQWSDRP